MSLDFLTSKFIIKEHDFKTPIIVTGAGGCIGSWVLSILTKSKIPCVGFDLSESKRRLNLILGDDAENVPWEKNDVTNYPELLNLVKKHNPSAIIHLAGLQVPFCAADPALGARVNVEGTINVFEVCRKIGLRRIVYASSVASLGMPPGGKWKETFYGVYKQANEHTAYVYNSDLQIPSIGIRPNIVYGLTRDQGVSSKNTIAIQSAVLDEEYDIPYKGKYSWLYAGEAASAFIYSVMKEFTKAYVFNLNGQCETIENGISILKSLKPEAKVTCSGQNFPFPPDLSDEPLRKLIGNYPTYSVEEGISDTYNSFKQLKELGRCPEINKVN